MLAAVHPVLTNGRTGVRSKVLETCGVRCRSSHDGGVLHCASVLECALYSSNRGTLLADSNVDAANLLVGVAGLPVSLLVDDGVDRDSGLTGLTVTNDELTLSTTNGDHGVNSLDTGLHGLVHRLTLHNARSLELESTTALNLLDVTETIDGVTQWVNHATEVAFANGNGENLASAGYFHTFHDAGELTEDNNTDLVLVEVQGETKSAICEADELVSHHTGQALNVCDTVGCVDDVANFGLRSLGGLVGRNEVLESVADLVGADRKFCHCVFLV